MSDLEAAAENAPLTGQVRSLLRERVLVHQDAFGLPRPDDGTMS